MANEAYADISTGWFSNNVNTNGRYSVGNTYRSSRYEDWKNDYIWIPSITEIGANNYLQTSSIWRLTDNQRASTLASGSQNNVWVRTGYYPSYIGAYGLSDTGALAGIGNTNSCSVRPAIHLNLTEAFFKKLYVSNPISKVYTGAEQDIEDAFTTDALSYLTIKYYDEKTQMELTGKPKFAGDYLVEIKIDSSLTDKVWATGDPTDLTRKIVFKITPKPVDFPTWFNNKNEGTYDGGNPLSFRLSYDTSLITVTPPSGVTITNNVSVTASEVGTYEFTADLKDKKNYKWATTDNELKLTINPMPIGLSLTDSSNNTNFTSSTTSPLSAIVTMDLNNHSPLHTGKQVVVNVLADFGDPNNPNNYETIGTLTLGSSTTSSSYPVNLNFSTLIDDCDYALKLEIDKTQLDGKYYTVEQLTNNTLSLKSGVRTVLTWRLNIDGSPVFNQYTNASIGQTSVAFSGNTITYDENKRYSFDALAPSGYEVDTNGYGVGGYLVTPATSTNTNAGVNADNYTTKVQLREIDNHSNTQIYEITWTIEKAVYDLSNVKWKGDGKVEYNEGLDVSPELDLSDPALAGLVPHYTGSTVGNSVVNNDGGTVHVSFTLASGYEDNYELPQNGGKGTNYTFTGSGDFEWTKDWEVVPAVIKLEWENKQVTDSNDNTFNVLVLKDPRVVGKVDYLYYPTNNHGVVDTSKQPLEEDEIVYSATDRQYFIAVPTIQSGYAANYKFPDNVQPEDIHSELFIVGGGSSAAQVSLSKTEYEYNNGKPVKLSFNLVSVTQAQLSLTYYSGDIVDEENRLDGAPTDVGNYLVVIMSNTPSVVLSGTTQYEFEITKNRVSTDWKTGAKPPVLDLKYGQINGVEYEIIDSAGNPVTNVKGISAGDYKIKAKIKDTKNYIFVDDTYETDYVDFTVREGDEMFDPNDPDNPYYPQDDPDNPTPPTDDKGGNAFVDFFKNLIEKHFPLWQVCTMAASALLALIFLIKAIQYGGRARKAKGEAKKIASRAYASLLPIFSGEVVALNLSNKIWSIMAFAFVGLALLMFVVALITRHSWKKAELAKEAAIEDGELRKRNADREEREAEREERREFQERMMQVGTTGGVGDYSGIEELLRQRDEEHRREMEAIREEQAKRDEAMKLMFANMMGRQQGSEDGFAYASIDDTDMLVQRVIAGLLPAMQQMMPEATAYLTAPNEENEELKALVEEQSEEIRNMSEQMLALQEQIAAMNEERVDGVLLPDQSEEMQALSDQISELQQQLVEMTQDRVDGVLLPDESEEMTALTDKIAELQEQLITMSQQRVIVPSNQSEEIKALTDKIEELQNQLANPDQSEEIKALTAQISELQEQSNNNEDIKALTDKIAELQEQIASSDTSVVATADNSEVLARMDEMQKQIAALSVGNTVTNTVYVEKEADDDDDDDEEEWDSILDEDDDDFLEAVIVEEDGTVKKASPNFRMRLKESSDKNREWYAAIKNLFCSQKGVTYRVYKRVEKIRYQGQVVAVIGIAKRSIKLWLALKPYEYDARRYHHKDVSDKPRFVDVPLYVRVGSDRALTRAEELILALFQDLNMEARKRYTDRSIQELIFTLKHNRLLTNKQYKQNLCEVMHVHDCDVLDDETAEKCIETKNVDFIDDSVIETVKLDDIDANFQDGNRVTLEKLRKLGLVSEACTGYTVTADKRLTKPLIIVANDFTLEAVKMIALTGGRAIRLTQV
ncbi:MAG: uL15 family ribosomal protein [Firmicutes bacterium]|nr:uL15 family ribosomal protein [Bacillota bacterium]